MSKAVIAIHGGAGAITRAQLSPEQEKRYIDALYAIVETGQKMLEAGESLFFELSGRILQAHVNENGVLSCLILRDAMPEDLY